MPISPRSKSIYPYFLIKSRSIRLYLEGLKGLGDWIQRNGILRKIQYQALKIASLLFIARHILFNFEHEFEKLDRPNLLVPELIYESRRDHTRFWELSRLRRKKSTIYDFYYFQLKQQNLFHVDRFGNHIFEKNSLDVENEVISSNLLFEKYVREYRHSGDQEALEKGTLLFGYERHRNNPFEIENDLLYKSVTFGDWLRAGYYFIMTRAKFTNHFRYDHLAYKWDWVYEYEKAKKAVNFNNKDFLFRKNILALLWEKYWCEPRVDDKD